MRGKVRDERRRLPRLIDRDQTGSKFWIVRIRKDGHEKRRHLGRYPEMTLKDARLAAIAKKDELVFSDKS